MNDRNLMYLLQQNKYMHYLKLKILVFLLMITHISCDSYTAASPAFHPVELICDYENNPLGIDNEKPLFSWKIVSQKKSIKRLDLLLSCNIFLPRFLLILIYINNISLFCPNFL